jgi:rhodanese-related sulfurtransferase
MFFGSKSAALRDFSPHELRDALAQGGVTLVDVREPNEFASARIAGAINLPLSRFNPAELPAGEVILHCGVGRRSASAAGVAAKAGRPVTGHLAGGLNAWMSAGLPVVR